MPGPINKAAYNYLRGVRNAPSESVYQAYTKLRIGRPVYRGQAIRICPLSPAYIDLYFISRY